MGVPTVTIKIPESLIASYELVTDNAPEEMSLESDSLTCGSFKCGSPDAIFLMTLG